MTTLAPPGTTTSPRTDPKVDDDAGARARRNVTVFASLALLAWAIIELASLVSRHTTGPELYGVLVAALAVVAGFINLAAVTSPRARLWVIVAAVLWAIVALGGLAGVAAHVVGPSAEYGPVDPRPRPTLAPLVFTAIGAVGGLVAILGRRAGAYRSRTPGEE